MVSSQVLNEFCALLIVGGFVAAAISLVIRFALELNPKFDLIFLDVVCSLVLRLIVGMFDDFWILHGDLVGVVSIFIGFSIVCAMSGRWTIPEDKSCNSK